MSESPNVWSRTWNTGSGQSYYELTPEFCAARRWGLAGDLLRPSDMDVAKCWDQRSAE